MIVRLGQFFFRYRNLLFPSAIVIAFVEGPETFSSTFLAAGLGLVVAAAGQTVRALTIGLDYIVRGGREGKVYADELVTGGLFAHCRNPLYLGNLLIIFGLAIAADSLAALIAAPVLFIFAYHCIVSAEEDFLSAKFGDEFRRYCERTPRFGVRWKGLATTIRAMPFRWRRVVVKEYGTPFAWILGIAVLTISNVLEERELDDSWDVIYNVSGVVGVLALLWLGTWYLKKTRRLSAD